MQSEYKFLRRAFRGVVSSVHRGGCGIPVATGVKLTLIVQLAPRATELVPVGQVLSAAMAKSAACAPVMLMSQLLPSPQ